MPPFFFPPSTPPPADLSDDDSWRSRTYSQYLQGVPDHAYEWSLSWVQVCRFAMELPQGFEFFAGRFASLGVDRLGLARSEAVELLQAIASKGARVPGTSMILRVERPWCALLEPAVGDEPMLPAHWLEGLELHGEPASFWIGKRVPEHPICPALPDASSEIAFGARNRFANFDWSVYESSNYGWRLRDSSALPALLLGSKVIDAFRP